MTATWVSASCSLCNPTPPCLHNAASAVKAAVSRVRAISVARLCRAGANRSSQSRPGRITSAQISTSSPGLRCGSGLRPAGADQVAPVGLVLAAAGHPSLLPAVAGLGSQPVHDGQHPHPASLLTVRVVQRERRRQHPIEDRGPARLGHRPRRDDRSGWERGGQVRPGPLHRPGHRGRGIGGSRRQHLRVDAGHDSASPNRICKLSARYPAAGAAAGSRSRWRAWKASTPAITSSVTGFK